MLLTMPEAPYAVSVHASIQYGSVPGLPPWQGSLYLDLLLPEPAPAEPAPAVVYLHPGGWRAGDRSSGLYPWISPLLVANGYVAANVSYRLSGREDLAANRTTAPFPAQLHDVKAAVRWLRAQSGTYGVDPDRIGVWGDSAGGQLAALLGVTANRPDLEGLCGSGGFSSAVGAVIMRCAPSDFVALPDAAAEVLDPLFGGPAAGTVDLRRLASPLTHVHAGAPPFLIVHGTRDETVPFSGAEALADALKAHGVEATLDPVEGGYHNLLADEDAPWGVEPWSALGVQALAFFRRTLGPGRT